MFENQGAGGGDLNEHDAYDDDMIMILVRHVVALLMVFLAMIMGYVRDCAHDGNLDVDWGRVGERVYDDGAWCFVMM